MLIELPLDVIEINSHNSLFLTSVSFFLTFSCIFLSDAAAISNSSAFPLIGVSACFLLVSPIFLLGVLEYGELGDLAVCRVLGVPIFPLLLDVGVSDLNRRLDLSDLAVSISFCLVMHSFSTFVCPFFCLVGEHCRFLFWTSSEN